VKRNFPKTKKLFNKQNFIIMKKIFTILALVSVSALFAEVDLPANWVEDHHNVVYDCSAGTFLATAPEIDQTFTFAIDITGHPGLQFFMNDYTLSSTGEKSIALHIYTGPGDTYACDFRLMHMGGNIYGATINFSHFIGNAQGSPMLPADFLATLTEPGAVNWFHAIVIGFGYGAAGEGIDWWNWAAHNGDVTGGFGTLHFATAPYTGTKTGEIFYGDDDTENPYIFYQGESTGLAAPCSNVYASVQGQIFDKGTVVSVEYFDILGRKVSNDRKGLVIERVLYSSGKVENNKIVR
jgi:hypothetical protein